MFNKPCSLNNLTKPNPNTKLKNTMCIGVLARQLQTEGFTITELGQPCTRKPSECRGAHHPAEISPNPNYKNFEEKHFEKFNLLTIQNAIYREITNKGHRVKNRENFGAILTRYKSLTFDQLLIGYIELARFHNAIAKPRAYEKINPNDFGYTSKEDVPVFKLDGLDEINEDEVWFLERKLHFCKDRINPCDKTSRSQSSLCIGEFTPNCKLGVHNIKHLVCIPNLILGICECPTQAEIDRLETLKRSEIELLEASLVPKENLQVDDGFVMAKKKPLPISRSSPSSVLQHRDTINQIAIRQGEIREMGRMNHLTERGLVPFYVQVEKDCKVQLEKAAASTDTLIKPSGPVTRLRTRPVIP